MCRKPEIDTLSSIKLSPYWAVWIDEKNKGPDFQTEIYLSFFDVNACEMVSPEKTIEIFILRKFNT